MAGNKYGKELKSRILSDYKSGLSQKDICKKYNIIKCTVCRIVKSEKVETVHKGGRPRKTTKRDDTNIKIKIKKDPEISSKQLKNELNLNVTSRTIRRRAVEFGLKSYRPAKKPLISKKNLKARLEFARTHINWNLQKWKTVLFSDETKFNLRGSDGLRHVRRPKGERLNPRYTNKTVKFGGGNLMFWGCFSGHGVGPLFKIDGIMDAVKYKEILEETMLPYADEHMPLLWTFQHDNDPKHTSKLVKCWIRNNGVRLLVWPAQSPDLNPIENLWEIVKYNLRKQNFSKKLDLYTAVKEEWERIPKCIIDNLISSMLRRCAQVIKNKGHSIKY